METSPESLNGRRTIYLDSRTLAEVKALLNGRASGRIFATRNGTPLKSGDVNRDVLRAICGQVGIPVGTMHAFGHGRVPAMESGGMPRKIIKLEIGHNSLRMTERTSLRNSARLRLKSWLFDCPKIVPNSVDATMVAR